MNPYKIPRIHICGVLRADFTSQSSGSSAGSFVIRFFFFNCFGFRPSSIFNPISAGRSFIQKNCGRAVIQKRRSPQSHIVVFHSKVLNIQAIIRGKITPPAYENVINILLIWPLLFSHQLLITVVQARLSLKYIDTPTARPNPNTNPHAESKYPHIITIIEVNNVVQKIVRRGPNPMALS